MSRACAPNLIVADDILDFTLRVRTSAAQQSTAVRRAGDPRRNLQSATGSHGNRALPSDLAVTLLHLGHATGSSFHNGGDDWGGCSVLGSAGRIWGYDAVGSQTGGRALPCAVARPEFGRVDETAQSRPWSEPICRTWCFARSTLAAMPMHNRPPVRWEKLPPCRQVKPTLPALSALAPVGFRREPGTSGSISLSLPGTVSDGKLICVAIGGDDMSQANTKLVYHIDCPGGGQVWADGTTLYVGHMRPSAGPTIFDVADPTAPRVLATIAARRGMHSHKVRAANGLMIINQENIGGPDGEGGIDTYDVSRPSDPKLISRWRTGGRGVHRFDFDGRYAYISPTVSRGYVGNIVMILDLADPSHPVEVGRWWILGQWTAGGETYPWHDWAQPRCHHPLQHGDRLYVSYWHHGLFILDISDMSKPRLVSQLTPARTSPASYTYLPSHSADNKGQARVDRGRRRCGRLGPTPPAFSWTFDITEEKHPVPISTFQVPGLDRDGDPQPDMTELQPAIPNG